MYKYLIALLCLTLLLTSCGVTRKGTSGGQSGGSNGTNTHALIIDHTCTNRHSIPTAYIAAVTSNLHIAYGHTSHGSQLIDGINGLTGFDPRFGTVPDIDESIGGYGYPYGAADLNQPDYTAWEQATRLYLASHPSINVVMWSWCGGVAGATTADIDGYLSLMSGLERDYPQIRFVYMTGHLDGTGVTGTLHRNNERIRAYCRNNNKILYDFADIESYDPDGNGYLALNADDACNYTGGNWAQAWQASHTINVDWYSCHAEHSEALNGNRKAYAAWWLLARLAGWGG